MDIQKRLPFPAIFQTKVLIKMATPNEKEVPDITSDGTTPVPVPLPVLETLESPGPEVGNQLETDLVSVRFD